MAEFTAAVESYDRFMGRYANGLAPKLADAVGVRAGMRVLDVGCGPGALAVELAVRVGEDNVAAIDPAPQFAAACRARIPGADVREGVAESLPWDDGTFDAAMCSLVVAWMNDADQGIGEMARVTKPGGTVAAAMWDIPGGGLQMLSHFWRAAREIDPSIADEQPRAGVREGDLVERFGRAGLQGVTGGTLETSVDYADFDDYWEPFTGGAGPATGAFYASLDDAGKATLRDTVRASLPDGPFTLPARAWLALGTVPLTPQRAPPELDEGAGEQQDDEREQAVQAVHPAAALVGVADQEHLHRPDDRQQEGDADAAPRAPEGDDREQEDDDLDAVRDSTPPR